MGGWVGEWMDGWMDGWVLAQGQPSRGRQGWASFGPFSPRCELDADVVAQPSCSAVCGVAVSQIYSPSTVCRVPCCQPAFGRAAPALLPSAGTHPQQGLIPVLLCPCPSQGGFPGQAGAARACSHRCPAAMSEGWGPGNSTGLSSAALAHWEMLAAKAKFEKGALSAPLCQEPQRDGSVCPTQCPGCRS